ncbi:amino acid/amide ABC transporter membrane protein 1 (HAAT family) [Roseiarcus fermentans]|uniref:Amino acid/amide ABC transporter membrane protein 1 (HAAT family) n=1 Tax=Roseiarcus fermentans TaxID=1473586 RepID=A0A366F9S0_9HYPH|nr:branched-chain amino acid ABC transporter permease [Roseiarcus fermentans]RBP11358.1 amino acid/amide ABC transporter membrane protein 1 (HAAT family) [Roseiarcus fermentans]
MNIVQLLVDAASLGSQYALVALGIGLVFGVMRMINFAHGDLIMIGAYALVVPTAADLAAPLIGAWPFPLLIAGILCVVTLVALATERFAFRALRKRGADGSTLLISSFAVSYLIQSLVLFIHTGRPKSVSIFGALTQQVTIHGVRVGLVDIVTIIVTILLLLGLSLYLRRSRAGIEIRAAAEDFTMARMLGVRADRAIALAFGLSGILAAAVSLLYVAKTGVLDFRMGVPLAIAGFVGTVIGGMGSLPGAVLGGFSLGAASMLLQALLPAELRPARDAFVYGLVIVVLLFRPQGLFVTGNAGERI